MFQIYVIPAKFQKMPATSYDSIGDINFKMLNGAIENISRQGQNDVLGALLLYIKCTNRFEQN